MGLIGDIAGAVWNGLTTGHEYYVQSQQNKIQNEYAQQNLQLQKDTLQYQKDLQQQVFNREDSAYQRTVADLQKAGLHVGNAISGGTNSSGAIVATQAPQINYSPNTSARSRNLSISSDILDTVQRFKIMQAEVDEKKAKAAEAQNNANYAAELAREKEIENNVKSRSADSRVSQEESKAKEYALSVVTQQLKNEGMSSDNAKKEAERVVAEIEAENIRYYGKKPVSKAGQIGYDVGLVYRDTLKRGDALVKGALKWTKNRAKDVKKLVGKYNDYAKKSNDKTVKENK